MSTSSPKTAAELRAEIDRLRQLLQAGVALASDVVAGDDVIDELETWIAAATAPAPSSD
jgi:hypothetical protein